MNFTTGNDKLHNDGYSYSSISDAGLLSLLRSPLPSLDMPVSSASFVSQPRCFGDPPLEDSFEDPFDDDPVDDDPVDDTPFDNPFDDPFDDASMEPMPLGPNSSSRHQVPIMQSLDSSPSESVFLADNDCLLSSFKELNKPLATTSTKFQHEGLVSLLDLSKEVVGSKRSFDDDLFSDRSSVKRQRSSLSQACTHRGGESIARFRPHQEMQWGVQFKKLIQYKLENGHSCVPHAYTEDPVLARWVKRQRYQYKKFNDCDPTSTMTTRRIQQLEESIGFVWHTHAAAWQEKLNELKAFKQSKGHCNVPSHYAENVSLSTWVKCQRRQYKLYACGKSSTMTMERFRLLKSLDFVFQPQLLAI